MVRLNDKFIPFSPNLLLFNRFHFFVLQQNGKLQRRLILLHLFSLSFLAMDNNRGLGMKALPLEICENCYGVLLGEDNTFLDYYYNEEESAMMNWFLNSE